MVQCDAVRCSVLWSVAVCCSVLQCVAKCCSVSQCVAVCCSALQYVAVRCSMNVTRMPLTLEVHGLDQVYGLVQVYE